MIEPWAPFIPEEDAHCCLSILHEDINVDVDAEGWRGMFRSWMESVVAWAEQS